MRCHCSTKITRFSTLFLHGAQGRDATVERFGHIENVRGSIPQDAHHFFYAEPNRDHRCENQAEEPGLVRFPTRV